MSDEFKHYGILRKSGRYKWGSGGDEYTRSKDFYSYIATLKDEVIASGVDPKNADREVAKLIGLGTGDDRGYSVADLRDTRTIAKEQIVIEQTNRAKALQAKDWSIEAIAKNLDIPAPTVRLRLKNSDNLAESSLRKTAEILRKAVDDNDIVDIGKGVALRMGLNSPERLRAAASVLRDEGYLSYTVPVRNPGTQHFTRQQVLTKPGTTFGDARRMTDRIHTMGEWTEDGGKTFLGIHSPLSVSPNRIKVVYAEDGGTDRDGTMFIRAGVDDLSMGKNNYAQVRIKVGDTHYLKGMALQDQDMAPGADIVFFTNKKRGTPIMGDSNNTVLKVLEPDEDNPFGSVISRQIVGTDPKTGKEVVTSALNMLREEGEWTEWRNSLPSQMLAKQPHTLIKSQLKETRDQTEARLAEIQSITNPVVRVKKLQDYADQIDADAVDLRAAAMPGQKTRVIIPVPNLNPREIYAPQFKTGESVVLIRYPHGGRFEIPEVIVNNNSRTAKKLLGDAPDAIGIHPKTAEKLSGADFDGDTVIVIPNPKGVIKGADTADNYYASALKGFDPKKQYGGYEVIGQDKKGNDIGNFKLMKNTGKEMGMITNLVTDMQVQGAKPEHVVRAVKHSMVVIDAEKHKLDYRRSAIDNGIPQLKEVYQGSAKSGAKTLLSRATSEKMVDQRKLRPAAQGGAIDKETGALVYVPTGKSNSKYDAKTKTYMDGKDGRPLEKVMKQQPVKRLALTDDAFNLVRDKNDPVEKLYAEHANTMKALANQARLIADRTPPMKTNDAAKVVYKAEVDKLVADVKAAQAQKPLFRMADRVAGITVKQKRDEDPLLRTDRDRLNKVERQAKSAARQRLGIKTPVIEITDTQWDAIQSGAVSPSRLKAILEYADPKRVETLALPRVNTVMTSAISGRAKAMLAAGATTADVAAALGIPQSTLREAAKRGDL